MFQIVHVLYQENDWVYVISESNSEGFIPHSYCAQFGSQGCHNIQPNNINCKTKPKMSQGDQENGKNLPLTQILGVSAAGGLSQ